MVALLAVQVFRRQIITRPVAYGKPAVRACVKGGVMGDQWGGGKGSQWEQGLRGISGEKGLWSVAEEAFLPRSAFGGSSVGGRIPFAAALSEAVTVAVHEVAFRRLVDVDIHAFKRVNVRVTCQLSPLSQCYRAVEKC